MTILPELERALVQAAQPQRRWRPGGAGIAALAVAAVAVLAVLGARAWWPADAGEEPATATPAPQRPAEALASSYRVFARPARSRDRLPKQFGGRRSQPLGGMTLDYDESRLVATSAAARAYAIPATDPAGKPGVCAVVALKGGAGGLGCGAYSTSPGTELPVRLRTTVSGKSLYFFLTPDGVSEVQLTLRDGTTVTGHAQGNGVLIGPTRGAGRISWVDSAGRRHSEGQHDDPDDETD